MGFPNPFTGLVGCELPIQLAGMGGMATPDLARAVSRAGGLGMLSGVGERVDLVAQLDGAAAEGLLVGVNFLVPFLDVAAVEDAAGRCRLVEAFWGPPDADLVRRIHEGGSLAAWQVGTADEASAAVDAGCDIVIAQGIEAGGHVRGTVGLLPLLDEIGRRRDMTVPVVAAGGIGTGRSMAAAFVAGADAVRLGTRFLAATESAAHPDYVDALIGAAADDTVLTTAFGLGWPEAPHRVLRSAVAAGEALGDAQRWTPNWPTIADPGPVAARALYAGQSVGAIRKRQSAAEIIAELLQEASGSNTHDGEP
ncbi:MAG TPA: nitronate monooxygenase [Acidimicrobiales bacterium]|nr:nitronate monooxygenase [Acidimicrobiales bacterium]